MFRDPIKWPSDVLGRFLHFLALDCDVNAQRVWQQLAYCVLKDNDLAQTAQRAARPMIFQIQFDDTSAASHKFKIPFHQAKIACIDVYWGDGCVDAVREVGSGFIEHEYKQAGDYTIRVFPFCDSNDVQVSLDHLGFEMATVGKSTVTWWQPLRSIVGFGSCGVRSLSYLFHMAANLRIDLRGMDLRNINDVSGLFHCASEFNQPIGGWNTSRISNMKFMFHRASEFNQPIGQWDLSNVTNMCYMLDMASSFNQPIGNWNVSKVTNMSGLFSRTAFNQPIGDWDVGNVTEMSYMFRGASAFNQPIGKWDVSNVTNTSNMFCKASAFNQPIGDWNVNNVKNMSGMFMEASSFNQPIGEWKVGRNTNVSCMFQGASAFNDTKPTVASQRH